MLLTPYRIAADGTEDAHQKAFMQWLAIEGPKTNIPHLNRVHAIPNGGDRTPSVAAAMKAGGVKRGVPDMCWPVPVGIYAGLYIELKRPGLERKPLGGRSIEQQEWHVFLIERHYAVVTAYGWQACCRTLFDYWAGQMVMPMTGDCLFVSA